MIGNLHSSRVDEQIHPAGIAEDVDRVRDALHDFGFEGFGDGSEDFLGQRCAEGGVVQVRGQDRVEIGHQDHGEGYHDRVAQGVVEDFGDLRVGVTGNEIRFGLDRF